MGLRPPVTGETRTEAQRPARTDRPRRPRARPDPPTSGDAGRSWSCLRPLPSREQCCCPAARPSTRDANPTREGGGPGRGGASRPPLSPRVRLPFSSEGGLVELDVPSTGHREASDPGHGSYQHDSRSDPRLDPLLIAASPELGLDAVAGVLAALSQIAHRPSKMTDHDDRSIPPEGDNVRSRPAPDDNSQRN